MTTKPMLNLGCGTIILPGVQPDHHRLIPAEVYDYPFWVNVDRNQTQGVDKIVDLFCYPWDFPDNSFSGAIVPHLAEHIPHEIRVRESEAYTIVGNLAVRDNSRNHELQSMQDGWFAFFSELWRILEPGAMVYVLSPYGWSAGAMGDPTHTRYVTEHTFYHSMQPSQAGATFSYQRKMHYDNVAILYTLSEWFGHLTPEPESGAGWDGMTREQQLEREIRNKEREIKFRHVLATQINVVTDICAYLKVVK